MAASPLQTFAAGDVVLQSGAILPDARLAYTTYGELDRARTNAIVYPTRYGGRHEDNEYLIGTEKALDPARYFIVVPHLLGNGVSTSPSNTTLTRGERYPLVTIYDNVLIQHRLLFERLGIQSIALAVGGSMGAQQAYQWAALFPDDVGRLAVICGAARTAPHTHVFLEGLKAALTADPSWREAVGGSDSPEAGLRALGRVWAGWGMSQAFYRERRYLDLGYLDLEDFLVRHWEAPYSGRDAADLMAMMQTWQAFDVSANDVFDGDFERALQTINAHVVLMPSATDLYFPPEDNAIEAALLNSCDLAVIPTIWGHAAAGEQAHADAAFIDARLRELLARTR